MKRLLTLLVLLTLAALPLRSEPRAYRVEDIPNVQVMDRTRFVSNPDGLLSASTVYRIDTMLYALRESGRAEVAVVAVRSIGDAEPFDFLQRLVTRWGVGRRDVDDGLGVLLVIDQGAIEIQTGYGLEGDLPDALLKRIIDRYMLPAFRQQDWDAGILAGLTAICEVLQGRTPADLTQSQGGNGAWLELLFFLGLPLLIIGLGWYNARRCPKCHKRALKRTDTRLISDTGSTRTEEVVYVCRNCGHTVVRRNTHGGGAGGVIIGGGLGGMMGGGGGFGRGGGGFGGGSFGGGGARGSF